MNLSRGFTLIELMISIGILAILGGIAYPIYANYIHNTHRIKAEQTLLMLSQDMEVYHSQHSTYLGANLQEIAPYALKKNDFYQFGINELTKNSYQLIAHSKREDKKCGSLRLDQLGEKTHTGSDSNSECWPG